MKNWQFNRIPQLIFGVDSRHRLAELMLSFGKRVLLITGQQSFDGQADARKLLQAWKDAGLIIVREKIGGEPSPAWVDACVQRHAHVGIELVVAIGGGSALDAAKAVAGLLPVQRSVMDYLEGVGAQLPYTGQALPFIAVPTTAGTGAEATKNAVLSRHGVDGFKKSFRHDSLMPAWAVIDPALMVSLPAKQIAANGLDAITQLIEGYTSTNATMLTDALALDGLRRALPALPKWVSNPHDVNAATDMAYAALVSGMVLAHTGLGAVHGLAAPLGAFFPIPHGVACGILLAETTTANIHALEVLDKHHPTLARYADIGRILMDQPMLTDHAATQALVAQLHQWQQAFNLPCLSDFGMTAAGIGLVVANSRGNSMKTNPVVLSDAVLSEILRREID
jgi:alcohol dehydrogenase